MQKGLAMKTRQTPIKLSMRFQCNESWEKMHEKATGKFCTSCCRTLVDFSGYSDAELLNYFHSNKGRICGRLRPGQMNRYLFPPSDPRKTNSFKSILGTILLFLIGKESFSEKDIPTASLYSFYDNNEAQQKNDKNESDTAGYVTGKVIDEILRTPVSGARIMIQGNSYEAVTNSEGQFSIPLDKKSFQKAELELLAVTSEGESEKIILRRDKNGEFICPVIEITEVFILGDIEPNHIDSADQPADTLKH
jgi:hypothetical protein